MGFCSLVDGFFVRTVTSDCLADKFGGQLENYTIRHPEWLHSSNRRRLGGKLRIHSLGLSQIMGMVEVVNK